MTYADDMNRGCAIVLVGYGACIAAYGFGVVGDFGTASGALAAIVGGVGVFMVLNSLRNGVATARRARLVAAAISGATPRTFSVAATIGTLEPQTEALEAPFSGESCLAYYCEIQRGATQHRLGFAFAPARVRTQAGYVDLAVAPVPQAFFTTQRPEIDAPERAAAWLESTPFEPAGRGAIATIIRASLGGAEVVGGEPVRFAYDLSQGESFDRTSDTLREATLPIGTPVCVLGATNEDPNTIVARSRWPVRSAEIFLEEPRVVQRALEKKAARLAALGSLFGLGLVGLSMFFF